MSHTIKQMDLGNGAEARIFIDRFEENPRDGGCHIGTLWCWHRQYDLGGKPERRDSRRPNTHDYDGWEALGKAITRDIKPVVMLPVYLYDHGGLALSTTPFSCPWDSGQVGFIFVERDKLKEYGAKIATKKVKERMIKTLEAEIEEYAAYANGDVYEWGLFVNNELIDSCSGYYGSDQMDRMFEDAAASLAAVKEDANVRSKST